MTGTDSIGTEKSIIFEYELPLNFKFEPDLSRTFSAIGLINGEYLGFLFKGPRDKDSFTTKILEL